MKAMVEPGLMQAGRVFGPGEIEHIRETVELFPKLSRSELAETICDHFQWYAPSGTRKRQACEKLLERLEAQGVVKLPAKRTRRALANRLPGEPGWSPRTDPGGELCAPLAAVQPVWLEQAATAESVALWNEYVGRHHYLGYTPPFGCHLRYFVRSGRGDLGCVLLAGAAKAIAARDRWVGWSRVERLRNLGWVVNNTRFLVFPWVRVPHLASHILGQVARQVGEDWHQRWGYRPLLMETFVDPARFRATCYRASGWERVGQTTGEGKPRRGKTYQTTVKDIYVRALQKEVRQRLCCPHLVGRQVEP
jgi:hypothetical protein